MSPWLKIPLFILATIVCTGLLVYAIAAALKLLLMFIGLIGVFLPVCLPLILIFGALFAMSAGK